MSTACFSCVNPVGPVERILGLRHPNEGIFFHGRNHPNERIFGSFSGSSSLHFVINVEWCCYSSRAIRIIKAFSKSLQHFNVIKDNLLDDDSLFFIVHVHEEDEQRGAEQVEEDQWEEQQLQQQRRQGRIWTERSSSQEEVEPNEPRRLIVATSRAIRGIYENDDGRETPLGGGQETLGDQQCRGRHTGATFTLFANVCLQIISMKLRCNWKSTNWLLLFPMTRLQNSWTERWSRPTEPTLPRSNIRKGNQYRLY